MSKTPSTTALPVPPRTVSDDARSPSSSESAPTMIDLPAPVSPVSAFSPSFSRTDRRSMTAKFSMRSSRSIREYRPRPPGASIAGCVGPLLGVLDCPVQFAAERLEERLSRQTNQLHCWFAAAHDETIPGLKVFTVLPIDGEDHLFRGRPDFNEDLRARGQNEGPDHQRVRADGRRQDTIDSGHHNASDCGKVVRC